MKKYLISVLAFILMEREAILQLFILTCYNKVVTINP